MILKILKDMEQRIHESEDIKEQISTGILKWVTPLLIVTVSFLLNRQITQIDQSVQQLNSKIQRIEDNQQIYINMSVEMKAEIRELQRRVDKLER
jgi:hypothetical protein